VDRSIENAINSVRSTRDAGEAAIVLRERMDAVRDEAERIEGRMWRRVPQKTPVDVRPLRSPANKMLKLMDTDPESVPMDILQRIDKLAVKYDGNIPLGKLNQLRTSILREAKGAGGWKAGGAPPNKILQSNLNVLNEAILDSMETALAGNPVMKQAREYSRAMTDRFQRGDLGDFFSRSDSGDLRVHPEDTMLRLLGKTRGPRALVGAMEDPLPGATPRGNRLQKGPAAISAANDALAARFRQLADEAGNNARVRNPEGVTEARADAASRFFKRHDAIIRPLHRAYTDIESTVQLIDDQLRERDVIRKSAVAQYAQRDPQNAVSAVINSPDPAATARDLRRSFGTDKDANEGFQGLLVETLMKRAGPSMIKTEQMFQQPKFHNLLRRTLDPDQYDRFMRLVQTGAALERGEGGSGPGMVRRGSSMLAHLLGLQVGRLLAHTFSTGQAGSLSIPARTASAFRDAVADSFANRGPSIIFREAVMDPKWERVLLSKLPSNADEAAKTMKILRRIVAKGAGARVGLTDVLAEDEGKK
jgi:hypothetical protein